MSRAKQIWVVESIVLQIKSCSFARTVLVRILLRSPSLTGGGERINGEEAGLISSCSGPLEELTGGNPLGESTTWFGQKAWAALLGWKEALGSPLGFGLCLNSLSKHLVLQ